ncbi:ASCH domain-containing protein [Corynebacterium uterequi]|uniref:ASCH domain-containing protein n=1 Tax=Corynebacterium uterequi TaxID=1072256 RepID=A0A0G3HI45_9CORY|nr:ASCH domain-containing protein [Corynebacterium uterequi]AKK10802.1 ASCH domain-containing protein [Corynebacterium uterequi]
MLTPTLRRFVADARRHAAVHDSNSDSDATTVAVLTSSNRIQFGHTELPATVPDDPPAACVVLRSPYGDVVAPPARIRDELRRRSPNAVCVLRDAAGLYPCPVSDVEPEPPYDGPQRINMWEGYLDSVAAKTKQQTIRVDDPFHVGPAVIEFDHADGSVTRLPAVVTAVEASQRSALTDAIARADGFHDLAELNAALDHHYPGLGADEELDIVTFRLC